MNNNEYSGPQAHLLRCHLSAFVPLVIQEYVLGQRALRFPRPDLAQVIAAQGDAILYRSPGRTAQAVFALVEALATMAFVPGGVDFLGLHFEVPPRQALAVLEEQQLLSSRPQLRPSPPPNPRPVEIAQPGRTGDLPSPTFQEIYRRALPPPHEE
jgi:hypothetical protein